MGLGSSKSPIFVNSGLGGLTDLNFTLANQNLVTNKTLDGFLHVKDFQFETVTSDYTGVRILAT